jgi:DNA-binding NtrC family response regulator
MEQQVKVLLVSSQRENKRTLLGVLRDLTVRPYVVSTWAQAKTLISRHEFSVVFCEELLPDGSYRDVFTFLREISNAAKFVLVLRDGEWEEYLEALRLGVEEVLRPPLMSIDVDLTLIHAFRRAVHGLEWQA